eukprot:2433875-Rhodomonas_salina.1
MRFRDNVMKVRGIEEGCEVWVGLGARTRARARAREDGERERKEGMRAAAGWGAAASKRIHG